MLSVGLFVALTTLSVFEVHSVIGGGGWWTEDCLHAHEYFDTGRMCACAAVPHFSALLNGPILYCSACFLWRKLIFIEPMVELRMFPVRLFCLFDIEKTIYAKEFFIS